MSCPEYRMKRKQEFQTMDKLQDSFLQMQQQMAALAKEKEEQEKKYERFFTKIQNESKGKITLDVGGKLYTTSLSTLCSDPKSMLAAMFSGRFELNQDEKGAVFLDRDGECFGNILHYLRSG